jgi:RNA polymerase sigma-70 factor (ECF subfamily)
MVNCPSLRANDCVWGFPVRPLGMLRLPSSDSAPLTGAAGKLHLSSAEPKPLPSTIVRDDEGALVTAAKGGDESAFEELVNRYERKIYRLALNITQNQAEAEDAMQDAFLKAFQHLADFQGGSRFYTWLVRIAVNESLMRLRKRRPNVVSLDDSIETEENPVPMQIPDWGPSPEQSYAREEMTEILTKVIEQLEPLYRVVFILRDVEEVSTEETAQILGISIPAVKSRLLRARLKLRELMNPYFQGRNKN